MEPTATPDPTEIGLMPAPSAAETGGADAPAICSERRSVKSTSCSLYPSVLTLAMLLPMVSRYVCVALIPDTAAKVLGPWEILLV